MRTFLILCLMACVAHVPLQAANGQQLWSKPFPPIAAPAVRSDGSIVAQSADTLLLVGSDGTEKWRIPVTATSSNSAQPPMIDDAGNIVVLTWDTVKSYDSAGTLRWSVPVEHSLGYTALALSRAGDVIIKTGELWIAVAPNGQERWRRGGGSGGPIFEGAPRNSSSPVAVAPNGTLRSVNTADQAEVRSDTTGQVITIDRGPDGLEFPRYTVSAFLALGPSGETLVVASRQPPSLSFPVEYLETPSAGNTRVRWTDDTGVGDRWWNAFQLGSRSDYFGTSEPPRYGLCAPSGEVLVATERGTIIMPHLGIGSRRWPETAFAVASSGEVLCRTGTHLVVRRPDQSVAWTAPAEGKHFVLAPNGRAYGGTQSLSAYDVGFSPAAGPWTQPRADAGHTCRAPLPAAPFTPTAKSVVEAAESQPLYDTYAGQVRAAPYVQGPGTLAWEKDGMEIGAAADDYSFVVPVASATNAGTYRLRVTTERETLRSAPITVSVVQPSPIRPGLYSGTLRAPSNAPYVLEIGVDRRIRYLAANGERLTRAMNIRLDPTGVYPWNFSVLPMGDVVTAIRATQAGVSFSWQNGPFEPAAPMADTVPSGAQTGWYDGNFVGPLDDSRTTEVALLPDGTLIGTLKAGAQNLLWSPLRLDVSALQQKVIVDNGTYGGNLRYELKITFDARGRVKFGAVSLPYVGRDPEPPGIPFEAFKAGAAPETRLVNLSVRTKAGAASGTLIAGFVAGTGGDFLVRGVGPTLAQYDVNAPLPTPALKLTRPDGSVLAQNAGWSTLDAAGRALLEDAARRTYAFPLQSGSRDAALLAPLVPGAYTALISSDDQGTTLAEVYTVPPTGSGPAPRLVNLSARGKLTPANPMMIVGFVHATDAARRILIRGVGPSLKRYVGDIQVCANPRLRVYDASSRLVYANNDWTKVSTYGSTESQYATVTEAGAAAGAFPLLYNSQDAAVVLNLSGGQYTVQLESEDTSTGEVLFEVYAVP